MSAADAATASGGHFMLLPAHWPEQVDLIGWCQAMDPGSAALLVMAGIVYLLFGYFLFKWLVLLNGSIIGFALGQWIGTRFGAPIASGILGAVLVATLCWPLMRYAVAVMGAMLGGVVGASLWMTFGQDSRFMWAGAMTGVVFFGMLTFILFRGSIIMYMSLQGSLMLMLGLFGLIYKYQDLDPRVTQGLTGNALVMPMVIIVPALIGLIYQQHNHPEQGAGKE